MKTDFSIQWNRSKKPNKQRKYRYNAPLHIKQKFMSSHLSKDLRKKYNKRSIGLRKGDKVKIARGQFKGKTGKVERCDLKRERVYIEGIDFTKKDGTKKAFPLHPSNLIITDLYIDDKKRMKRISGSKKKVEHNG